MEQAEKIAKETILALLTSEVLLNYKENRAKEAKKQKKKKKQITKIPPTLLFCCFIS